MHPIERLRFVARSQGAPAGLLVEEAAIALGAFRDDPAGMVAACRRIIDRQLTCGPLWWLCARMLCATDPMIEAHAAVAELLEDPTAASLAAGLPDDARVLVVEPSEETLAALVRRGDLRVLVLDVDHDARFGRDARFDHDARVGHDTRDVVGILDRAGIEVEVVPTRSVGAAMTVAQLVLVDALAAGPADALVAAGSMAAAAVARHCEVPVWLVAGVGRLMPERMWDALVGRWSASVDPLFADAEEIPLSLVSAIAGVAGPVEVEEALRQTDCPVAPELFRLAG